jgi:hypothetical protein
MRATPPTMPSSDAGLAKRAPKRARGVAAVEFAIILPVIILFLAFPIFFARVLMHYSVAQRAAHDGAMILSRTAFSEARTEQFYKANLELVRTIVQDEMTDLNPGIGQSVTVGLLCDDFPCGPSVPKNIRVTVQMRMYDDNYWWATVPFVGSEGVLVTGDVRMPYMGK